MDVTQHNNIPESFKPLLWGLRWNELDINEDKDDIILNVVNGGQISDWIWLLSTYGDDVIRSVLKKRLASELYPESRNLAKIFFGVNSFNHAR